MSHTLTSCNGIQSEIKNTQQLIENAEKNKDIMSKADFDKLEIKMDELQKNLDANRQDYTDEQVKEIGKLQGRYTSLILKKGLNDFKESVKDLGNQMEGFIEGISDSTDK
jgi:tetrahydromethanopterin S-methyltransferase subunit G